MEEDEDGICRATGIMRSSFYWDGENIIPQHDAFSGNNLGVFGELFVTYTPMYKPESWVKVSITAIFRNQRETAACKTQGEGYVSTMWGGCLKKCKQEDGVYVIDEFGKCIVNREIWSYKTPSSKIVQSDIYPDLEIILDREDYPHFTSYPKRFKFKEWPYKERPPIMEIGGIEFSRRIHNLTKGQLKSMNIGKIGFNSYQATSIHKSFYFEGGVAMTHVGKTSLHDAFPLSKKIYEYLSNVLIKEYKL